MPLQETTRVSTHEVSPEGLLPRPLSLFLWVSIWLTVGSLLFSEICRALHFGLPYSFPYFYEPGSMFSDFREFWPRFQALGQHQFYSAENFGFFTYPVPIILLLIPFFLGHHALTTFVFAVFLATGGCCFLFAKALRSAGLRGGLLALFVAGTVVLSYPLAMEYMRLNVEVLLFAFVACGVLAYWRDHSYMAAILFGVAASCKVYPFLFLGLLFAQRRYRPMLVGLVTWIAVILVSLWVVGPTIKEAYIWNTFQLSVFSNRNVGVISHLAYDHSFFGLAKFVTLPWRPDLNPWAPVYTRIAAILSVWFYFRNIVRLPLVNQIIILSALAVTIPPISYDYTLLSLYPGFVILAMLLLRNMRQGQEPSAGATWMMVLFAIIFSPLSFFTLYGARYSGQVRCICIVMLILAAKQYPISEQERGERDIWRWQDWRAIPFANGRSLVSVNQTRA